MYKDPSIRMYEFVTENSSMYTSQDEMRISALETCKEYYILDIKLSKGYYIYHVNSKQIRNFTLNW